MRSKGEFAAKVSATSVALGGGGGGGDSSDAAAARDPKMSPARYTRARQGGSLILRTGDIEGAQPGRRSAQRVRAPLDPLHPLGRPPPEEAAPTPKFVRDNLDVSDITGAQV